MILLGDPHRKARFGDSNRNARSGKDILQCGNRRPAAMVHDGARPVEDYTLEFHALVGLTARSARPNTGDFFVLCTASNKSARSIFLFITARITAPGGFLDDNSMSGRDETSGKQNSVFVTIA
jgi:hypothetical protein